MSKKKNKDLREFQRSPSRSSRRKGPQTRRSDKAFAWMIKLQEELKNS